MTFFKFLYAATIVTLPAAAAAQDWSGPYAGIQAGGSDIETSTELAGDGNSFGVFVGYNTRNNGVIYGGEFDYDTTEYEIGDDAVEVDSTFRLKGHVGALAGNGLMYGTAGFVRATSPELGDDTGYLFGVGYKMPVTSNITVGAELLQHEFEDYHDNGTNVSVTTLKANVGFAF